LFGQQNVFGLVDSGRKKGRTADIVVLAVDHRQFSLIDPEALRDKELVDTRGLWTWRKARKPDARIEGKKAREDRQRGFPLRRVTDRAA